MRRTFIATLLSCLLFYSTISHAGCRARCYKGATTSCQSATTCDASTLAHLQCADPYCWESCTGLSHASCCHVYGNIGAISDNNDP